MKKSLLALAVLISFIAIGQEKLNNYKYVVVPSKFDFQKKENQYGMNMLLKYKFQQLGFETYLDNEEIPEKLISKNCAVLKPVLKNTGGMFTTKVVVEVKDCYNNILFVTQEGISKIKNYKLGYNEALRNSLQSFGNYRLAYVPKIEEKDVVVTESVEEEKIVEVNAPKKVSSNEISPLPKKAKYNYEGVSYFIVKSGLMNGEIREVKSDIKVGELIESALKKGVYHILFDGKKGFCYFDEKGNLIIEYLLENGIVSMTGMSMI